MRPHIIAPLLLLTVTGFGGERRFVTSERLSLGTESNRSASVRLADVDSDGDLDAIIANGRHWPQQNYIFLNHGRARFTEQRRLGIDLATTYATEPADLDGDGDLDIVIGNDMAPNQILTNAGAARFATGGNFGSVSSLRSMTLADIDRDGDIDILVTCRGRANQICLNDGRGNFRHAGSFGTERDSTIDVAATDWNGDGHIDLVLANRDSQPNAILINDGKLAFSRTIPFGGSKQQTRAVVVADMNGDTYADIIVGNIGQPNVVILADGSGGFAATQEFGRPDSRTYSLAVADMDNDGDQDIVVGNTAQRNAVYFNHGDGRKFSLVEFGDETNATYSVDVGDVDGDGFADIAVANSDARNYVFLNRSARQRTSPPRPQIAKPGTLARATSARSSVDWPQFRGPGGKGVVHGVSLPSKWTVGANAEGILWSTRVPGLSHSSPVIKGNRLYLATAIATAGDAPLKITRGGRPDAADDNGEQKWTILCYDRLTGNEIWRKTARQGKPRATRHVKATHANTSVTIHGENLIAFFGSEGLYCYDLDGNLKWSRDLGVINISKYGIGWGYASSPAVHDDRIVIVCDDPDKPFLAALNLSDGKEIWRTDRTGICERSWGTPFVHTSPSRTQAVVNGWPWIVSYDVNNGSELWRIKGGGDNPVPTPFEANGWIYITNAHGAESPIFAVRPDAAGDISPQGEAGSNKAIVWSVRRGGSYMSTPLVYGDHLYLGNTNGVLRCFNAKTGKKVFEERLGSGASIYGSLVAADGKIFCASENGVVYVVKAGPVFEVAAKNQMNDPLYATPAIAGGVLYLRTTRRLYAIGKR